MRFAHEARLVPGVLELQGSPVVMGVTHLPTAVPAALHNCPPSQTSTRTQQLISICHMQVLQTSAHGCNAFDPRPAIMMCVQTLVCWQHPSGAITAQAFWPCTVHDALSRSADSAWMFYSACAVLSASSKCGLSAVLQVLISSRFSAQW